MSFFSYLRPNIMLTKHGHNATMTFHLMTVFDKEGGHCMKQGIIEAIGRSLPLARYEPQSQTSEANGHHIRS